MPAVAALLELSETLPTVEVRPEEYTRLLGYPRGHHLEGRARELAAMARDWYAANGRPWLYARQAENLDLASSSVIIDGTAFSAGHLVRTLRAAEAHSAVLVAVGAGPEAEQEAGRRWEDEKPDEYFFLEMFASAVVEQLTTATGARLCDWAEHQGLAVLPHDSPGYPEWNVAEQPDLLALMRRTRRQTFPSPVDVLDSGMLRPRKTLLAVFGLTRHADRLRRLTELSPCENCSFGPCSYRRAPYRRAIRSTPAAPRPPRLEPNAAYSIPRKALERWAGERLSLCRHDDGSLDAVFRYDGTTCTNMGRPLTFHYSVRLGPRAEGYPIREQRCAPASGDTGHTHMCGYIEQPEQLMSAIAAEKPLHGKPLASVFSWPREPSGAGCYCEPVSRHHKWGLVLETIHYALVQKELAEETGEP